jgi:hypothetical protein
MVGGSLRVLRLLPPLKLVHIHIQDKPNICHIQHANQTLYPLCLEFHYSSYVTLYVYTIIYTIDQGQRWNRNVLEEVMFYWRYLGVYELFMNRYGDVMIAPIDYGRSLVRVPIWSNQELYYKTGKYCSFTNKIKRKNIDLLARNQDNTLEWSDMFTHELLLLR